MGKKETSLSQKLGVIPYFIIGMILFGLGLMAVNEIINTYWPIDVQRLDLVRGVALDRVEATSLLQAANVEIILAFLAAVLVTITGLALPFAFFLNMRFGRRGRPYVIPPPFMTTLRQAMWVGIWAAFCVWLQMNRILGVAVAVLVAVVLILVELLLQIRAQTVAAKPNV